MKVQLWSLAHIALLYYYSLKFRATNRACWNLSSSSLKCEKKRAGNMSDQNKPVMINQSVFGLWTPFFSMVAPESLRATSNGPECLSFTDEGGSFNRMPRSSVDRNPASHKRRPKKGRKIRLTCFPIMMNMAPFSLIGLLETFRSPSAVNQPRF